MQHEKLREIPARGADEPDLAPEIEPLEGQR